MEANAVALTLAAILVVLIGLSLLFWLGRLIWEIVTSPTALAILIGVLALIVGLVALQTASSLHVPRLRSRITIPLDTPARGQPIFAFERWMLGTNKDETEMENSNG